MGMSFPKIVMLIPVLTCDAELVTAAGAGVREPTSMTGAASWDRLLYLVRERPVVTVVLDSAALPGVPGPEEKVADLGRRFPSLGCVVVSRPRTNPMTLLRLGRAGIGHVELVDWVDVRRYLQRAVARSAAGSCTAHVLRAITARIPLAERQVVRAALDGALAGWSAPELAACAGWTRPHLSARLRQCGLPSTGRLLLWARMLHAAHWAVEPGRTGESISRQLGYTDGPALRRALRSHLEVTPTELRERGGLRYALPRFLDVCGLHGSVRADLSVA